MHAPTAGMFGSCRAFFSICPASGGARFAGAYDAFLARHREDVLRLRCGKNESLHSGALFGVYHRLLLRAFEAGDVHVRSARFVGAFVRKAPRPRS